MSESTPSRLHSCEDIEAPFWVAKLDKFFRDNQPKDWLAELFSDEGNGDIDTFLQGIVLAKNRTWGLSRHFSTLHSFYTTDPAGVALIRLLRQRSLTSLKRKNAEEKTLGDLFDEVASTNAQVLCLVFLFLFFFFIPFLRDAQAVY